MKKIFFLLLLCGALMLSQTSVFSVGIDISPEMSELSSSSVLLSSESSENTSEASANGITLLSTETSDETHVLTGTGTKEDPILLEDIDDWNLFATSVNNGSLTTKGKYFELVNDLDFSGKDFTMVGATEANAFKGIFNGNGKTLSGININTDAINKIAVFPFINGATIKDLTISGMEVATTVKYTYVGCISAQTVKNGSPNVLENCIVRDAQFTHNTKSATANSFGGLIAYAMSELTITNCLVENLSLTENYCGSGTTPTFGGLVATFLSKDALTVSGCAVTGRINVNTIGTSKNLFIGGAFGVITSSVTDVDPGTVEIKNTYTDMDIDLDLVIDKSAAFTGTVKDYFGIGGMIGQIGQLGQKNVTISNCYVGTDFKITKSGSGALSETRIGRIVGNMRSNNSSSLTVENTSYNTTDTESIGLIGFAKAVTGEATQTVYIPGVYNGKNLFADDTIRARLFTYGKAVSDYIEGNPVEAVEYENNLDEYKSGEKRPVINNSEALTYYGSSLLLKDTCVKLRHYFTIVDAENIPSELIVNGEQVTLIKSGDRAYLDIQVKPEQFDTKIDVMNGDDVIISFSVLNYCSYALPLMDGNSNVANVIKALVGFVIPASELV